MGPPRDVVVHCASIVHQGEVGLSLAFARLGLLEVVGLAQVLVIELVLERVFPAPDSPLPKPREKQRVRGQAGGALAPGSPTGTRAGGYLPK
ncbi:hypothetical protein EK904_000670 [Melospiza melodia maxima]|nr:hypothetical protein EK904_000670 [Melospiza melodia maxima]